MDIVTALVLGVVQGITEFLPVSSDGHLVLTDILLGVSLPPRNALGFDILLHAASLLALLICTGTTWIALLRGALRRDRQALRLLSLVVVATIPGACAGLFLDDFIAGQRNIPAAAAGFVATALALIIGELVASQRGRGETHLDRLSMRQVLVIGCAQATALLPGVSRSGTTISTGLALGLTRRAAFDFSFLLAVPIISGAVAKGALDLLSGEVVLPGIAPAAAGFAASFAVSAGAYLVLREWVSRRSLAWFAVYLLPLACILALQHIDLFRLTDPDYLHHLLRNFGPFVLFLVAVAEATPPFSFVSPGIVVIILAGSLAPDLPTAVSFGVACTAGMLIANVLLYWVGRAYGHSIAHKFHLKERHLHAAQKLMNRIGAPAIIVGQFFGLIRPAVSFVAGTLILRRRVFLPSACVGAAIWAGTYIAMGYVLRQHVHVILPVIGFGGAALFFVMLLGIGGWSIIRRKTP